MASLWLRSIFALSLVCCVFRPAWSQESTKPQSAQEAKVTDWIRIGKSRYDWSWLQSRYDADRDHRVTAAELPVSVEVFRRIDRDWDEVLTATDFEWSKDSVLGKQKETSFALFKLADKDSNGRLSADEWQQVFEQFAGQDPYLSEEQLEKLMFQPRVRKSAKEEGLRTSSSEFSPGSLAAVPVPQPGNVAPEFTLPSPDNGTEISLAQYRGNKPVVLVFGCYTCGNYRTYSESLERMYRFWGQDAAFLRVYVREAHPTSKEDAATSTNQTAGILFEQPSSFGERCEIAKTFATTMEITTPMVVDQIDNRVGKAYGGWPDRLYIVDRDGRIAYTGGPGPFGFNPREMEQSLAMLLLDQAAPTSTTKP